MKKLRLMNGIYPQITNWDSEDARRYCKTMHNLYVYYLDGNHAFLVPWDEDNDFDEVCHLLSSVTDSWCFVDGIDAQILQYHNVPWLNI